MEDPKSKLDDLGVFPISGNLHRQELSSLDPHVFHLTPDEAGALVPEQRLVLRLGASCLNQEGQLEEWRNGPVDTSPAGGFACFLLCCVRVLLLFYGGFIVVSYLVVE